MASLSGSPASPWTTAQLTAATAALAESSYQVYVTNTDNPIPAWGVSYDLDERRAPFGTAKFTTTVAEAAAQATGLNPRANYPIFIRAGYSGVQSYVFVGVVTSRRRTPLGVQIELATHDVLLDAPLKSAVSGVSGIATAWNTIWNLDGGNQYVWGQGVGFVNAADINTPNSSQIAASQSLVFAAGDTAGDAIRTMAECLGQWIHGNQQYRSGQSGVIVRPRYTYSDTVAPTLTQVTDWERIENLDDYATHVKLTANWRDTSTEEEISVTRYFASSANMSSSLTRYARRDLTVQAPSNTAARAAALTALGTAYAANYYRRTWLISATTRAWWWLEPGASLKIANPDGGTDGGQVSRITVNVDTATMTVTLRPPTT